MPGFPAPFIRFQQFNANGDPLAGGKLYSYAAGTSTPLATYTTQALNVANLNPTILDAQGRASIWVQDGIGYKFVQKDALDNLIWSEDNVQVPQIAVPVTSTSAAVPPGTLMAYGGTTAPTGWLLCQGQPAATTGLYADLFAVILYRFGGAGGTFYIPDMRGKFPLGTAASGTGSTLAGTGGTIDHVHTGATHTHPVAAHTHTIAHHHSVPRDGWGETSAAQTPGRLQTCPTSGSGSESTVTQANTTTVTGDVDAPNSGTNTLGIITGDPSAANTGTANPPFLSLNFIIKYSLT